MRGRPKVTVLLLLATSLALLIAAGCSSSQQQSSTNQGASQSQTQTAPTTLKNTLVEQWAASAHAVPITFAAEETGCKNCHDGLTFSMTGGGFQPRVTPSSGASGSAGTSGTAGIKRDWVVATDCRACHTGEGVKIADAGTVSGIPSVASAKGGLGSLCMACHNGWHQGGSQKGALNAPHGSVQADMLYGVNTVPISAAASSTSGTAGSTSDQSPHLKITNTCVGCHMQTPSGAQLPEHTFLVTDFKTCQRSGCHKTDMTNGGTAKADYDGNGKTEAVTVEFDGLMAKLKTAINKKAGSTDFKSESGQIKFTGATVKGTDPAYKAAYNYFFAMNDLSKGIHNAPFTFKMLQDSLNSVK